MQSEFYLTSIQYDYLSESLRSDLDKIENILNDEKEKKSNIIEKKYIYKSLLYYFDELEYYQYDFENEIYIMYMPLFAKDMLIYYMLGKLN
ncbi:MAG: hypothetical protein HXM12_07350 [Fusobacterium periodonticum]|jgi:hypothetical protein|nr:hypothetical protein [Fusobacterium periodonticum]